MEETEEASAGLPNSDCCASIFAAARCAIARADRASDFTLATPAAVLDASVGGAANRDGEGGAAEIGPADPGFADFPLSPKLPAGSAGASNPPTPPNPPIPEDAEDPERPKTTVGIFVSDGFGDAPPPLADGVAPRRLPLAEGG